MGIIDDVKTTTGSGRNHQLNRLNREERLCGDISTKEMPQVAWLPLESWLESLVTDWHIPVTFVVPEFNSRYLEMSSLTIFGLVTWSTVKTNNSLQSCQAILGFDQHTRMRFFPIFPATVGIGTSLCREKEVLQGSQSGGHGERILDWRKPGPAKRQRGD
ncbi:MAG: hypothetical protein JW846_10340 [Dehalococcoidia bacterium]|nr:hypothetical protein [Dehalococcoidia bacterium]